MDKIADLQNETLKVITLNCMDYVQPIGDVKHMLKKPVTGFYVKGTIVPLCTTRKNKPYIMYKDGTTQKITGYTSVMKEAMNEDINVVDGTTGDVLVSGALFRSGMVEVNPKHLNSLKVITDHISWYITTNHSHRVLCDSPVTYQAVKAEYREEMVDTLSSTLSELELDLEDILSDYSTHVLRISPAGLSVRVRVLNDYRIFRYEEMIAKAKEEGVTDMMRSEENW